MSQKLARKPVPSDTAPSENHTIDTERALPALPNSSTEDLKEEPQTEYEEAAEAGSIKKPKIAILGAKFNTIMPNDRRYLGRSRKTFCIILWVLLIVILALAIGLGVGLSKKNSGSQNLPLPGNTETYTGDLTYYAPGLGSCGISSTDADMIVAISHYTFDAASTGSNPNANPLCGRKIRATRYNEEVGAQRSVDLTVVDRCVGCQPTDIDVSPSAFTKLAPMDLGRVTVEWAWLDT